MFETLWKILNSMEVYYTAGSTPRQWRVLLIDRAVNLMEKYRQIWKCLEKNGQL